MIFARLLRIVVALTFPLDFRREYGDDVLDTALKSVDGRKSAGRPVALHSVGILVDVARTGLAERGAASRPRLKGRRARLGHVGAFIQDLRYGARGLRRTPGFSVIAILTLALGIGGNTAIFSVLNSVLFQPPDFPDASRVVRLQLDRPVTARQVDGIAQRTRALRAVAGGARTSFTLIGDGRPEELQGSVIGPEHDEAFGVTPVLGRAFNNEDSAPGAAPVAMLSYELWQRRFGGEGSILGRTLALGGEQQTQRTVVGVWPERYAPFSWSSEVFVPMMRETGSHLYVDMARFQIAARLAGAATYASALDDFRSAVSDLASGSEGAYFSVDAASDARLVSYHEAEMGSARGGLWLLLGAVGIVLLIACTNVANLLLARANSRSHEFAIRTAIGAGRARLLRQLLTESVLLGALAGVVGWIGAMATLPLLIRVMPLAIPATHQVSIDMSVWIFAALVSVGTGLGVGLLPALRSANSVGLELRSGSAGSNGRPSRFRLNGALVAAQISLCVVLVVASGLLLKSLWLVSQVDPGFNAGQLYTFKARPVANAYPDIPSRRAYFDAVLARVRGVPGVEAAGAIQVLPLSRGNLGVGISPDGAPVPDGRRPMFVGYRMVTTGYGETMEIPLLDGRWFDRTDNGDAQPVGLINERMAARLFPNQTAVGRSVHWNTGDPWFTVVGVIGNVHQNRLDEDPRMEAYVPLAQDGDTEELHYMVRSSLGSALLPSLRQAAWSVDPQVPVTVEAAMDDIVTSSFADRRGAAALFSLFGLLALLLGAIGVYGITAHAVTQRTHEIGVRLALGAGRVAVVTSTVRASLVPVAVGLAIGLAAALATSPLLASALFGVTPGDPAVLLSVVASLALVAVLAAWAPAQRAAKTDPMTVLSRS